jgi:hypothetical protein
MALGADTIRPRWRLFDVQVVECHAKRKKGALGDISDLPFLFGNN